MPSTPGSSAPAPTSSARPRPSRRTARVAGVAAVVAGLLGSAALVWQASYSAFSSTTSNPTSNWSTGTVHLTDDDSDSALFDVTDLKPGDSGSRCIVVTSDGSLASSVKLYTTPGSFAQTNRLGDNIALTVTQGTIAHPLGGGSCTGFVGETGVTTSNTLTSFSSSYPDFSNGFGTFSPTGSGSQSAVYKIDYSLDGGVVNGVQGGTAAIGFTWEAQNS